MTVLFTVAFLSTRLYTAYGIRMVVNPVGSVGSFAAELPSIRGLVHTAALLAFAYFLYSTWQSMQTRARKKFDNIPREILYYERCLPAKAGVVPCLRGLNLSQRLLLIVVVAIICFEILHMVATQLGARTPSQAELEVELAPTDLVTTQGLALQVADRPQRIRRYVLQQQFVESDYQGIGEGGKAEVVYVIAKHLDDFVEKALPFALGPFVLVTTRGTAYVKNSEDNSVPGNAMSPELARRLLNDQRLLSWFTTNPSEVHPKLHPIPIGPDFWSQSTHWGWHVQDTEGDVCGWKCWALTLWRPGQLIEGRKSSKDQEAELSAIRQNLMPTSARKALVYSNVHLSRVDGYSTLTGFLSDGRSYSAQRWDEIDILKQNPLVVWATSRQRRKETLEEAGQFAFGLSVVGNGLDCYRTWEMLAIGMIVITKRTSLSDSGVFDGLPVVVLNDWGELTPDRLQEELAKYKEGTSDSSSWWERLQTKHWAHIVRAALGDSASLQPEGFNSATDTEFGNGESAVVDLPGQKEAWLLGTAKPGELAISFASVSARMALLTRQSLGKGWFLPPAYWFLSHAFFDLAGIATALLTSGRRDFLKLISKPLAYFEDDPPWCPVAQPPKPMQRMLLKDAPGVAALWSGSGNPAFPNLKPSLPLGPGAVPVVKIDDFVSHAEVAAVLEEVEGWGWHGAYEPDNPVSSRLRQDWDLPWIRQYPAMVKVYRKIVDFLGISDEYAGSVTFLQYGRGHGYAPHIDWFGKGSDASWRNCGPRSFTFLIYLNAVPEGAGGETHFLHYDLKVQAVPGRALAWSSASPDDPNEPDERSRHQSLPVLVPNVTKMVMSVFFQQMPVGINEGAGCC